jgi:hypothetical protein
LKICRSIWSDGRSTVGLSVMTGVRHSKNVARERLRHDKKSSGSRDGRRPVSGRCPALEASPEIVVPLGRLQHAVAIMR